MYKLLTRASAGPSSAAPASAARPGPAAGGLILQPPADREKTVLFIVNLSTESADVDLRLYPEEYGALCPETLHLTMPPMTAESIEYARKI